MQRGEGALSTAIGSIARARARWSDGRETEEEGEGEGDAREEQAMWLSKDGSRTVRPGRMYGTAYLQEESGATGGRKKAQTGRMSERQVRSLCRHKRLGGKLRRLSVDCGASPELQIERRVAGRTASREDESRRKKQRKNGEKGR